MVRAMCTACNTEADIALVYHGPAEGNNEPETTSMELMASHWVCRNCFRIWKQDGKAMNCYLCYWSDNDGYEYRSVKKWKYNRDTGNYDSSGTAHTKKRRRAGGNNN